MGLEELKGNMFVPSSEEGGKDISVQPKGDKAGLHGKWDSLRSDYPADIANGVYISEVRKVKKFRRGGRWAKSTLKATMREQIGMDEMLYWDDYSEGLFIGRHGTAYNLHADQMQTSNIGTQFQGHKILAIWQYPEVTQDVLETHFRSVFAPPLLPDQIELLERAVCVAVVPPGAVWVFSGANAHATCNLGFQPVDPSLPGPPLPCLCLNSYEAFCGCNIDHVKALVATNTDPMHWDGCWMDDEDLEDFKSDVKRNVLALITQLANGASSDAVPVLVEAIKIAHPWASDLEPGSEGADHGQIWGPIEQHFKKQKTKLQEAEQLMASQFNKPPSSGQDAEISKTNMCSQNGSVGIRAGN